MNHLGWYSRGYIPHCDSAGAVQVITFRLADSLPSEVCARIDARALAVNRTARPAMRYKLVEANLDQGFGSCLLKQPTCGQIVSGALQHFHNERYELIAYVVMPNHVHVMIRQWEGWSLGSVLRSWKGFTSRKIRQHALGPLPETIWQRGYWDRLVRDELHYDASVRYITSNPVKAGLVSCSSEWPWLGFPLT